MAERSVAVKLSARVDAYMAAMRQASAATLGFSRATERNLQVVGSQMQTVGRSMTTFVTAPLVLMGAAAVKSAVDWESSWAGVTKTVDGTTEQMAALEQGLRDMSKELPATHQEIAAVAEAAGALGVAQEDILDFTRVMIDLGETTNLTADQAATSIAQLMNVMQTAPDDVDNLGSALVHLGNTGASTEAEILDMAQRIAGAGQLIGLSEAEVLGFAASMADLGINAELGGTAIQRVFLKMETAVKSGGEQLSNFARVAGVSAEEFATIYETRPAQAVEMFLAGLQRIDSQGGNVIATLGDMGLSGQLVQQVLLRLMGAGDGLTDSLARSADAWGENTALTDEAAKRYETAAAQFEMVRNKIVDLFIDLGEMVLPVISAVVDGIGVLAEQFQQLPAPVQAAIGGFLGLVAAMGPIMFIGGSLMKNLTTLTSLFHLTGGAASIAAKGFGLVGIAAMAAFAGYQILTAEQRQTEANTKASSAALDTQFTSLLNAAVAAATTAEQIDAVAMANEALSVAIAEGNTQLAESAATLNISSEQILDVLSLMEADGESLVTTLDFLARSFGLTAEQADFFARNYSGLMSTVPGVTNALRAQGAELGITEEQFDALTTATSRFFDAADESDVDAIARQFLDARVSAFGYEESLVALAEANTGLSRSGPGAIEVYNEWVRLMAEADPATRAVAGVTDEVAAAISAAGVSADGAVPPLEDITETALSAADAMGILADAFEISKFQAFHGGGFNQGVVAMREWREVFSEALSTATGDAIRWVEVQDALYDNSLKFSEAIDDSSLSLDQNSEAGLTNRGVLIDWTKDIIANAEAQLASGDSVENVTASMKVNRQAMIDAAVAAGFNEQEVLALVDALGLADDDWNAVLSVSGDDIAMQKINAMLVELDTVDQGVIAELNTIIGTEGAIAGLEWLKRHINSQTAKVGVDVRINNPRISVTSSQGTVNAGRITAIPNAKGAYVNRPTLGLVGEAGDEVILPLTNPSRMSALLGLPEVGPRVAAAMAGWMPQHGWSGGGGGDAVYNLTINHNGPGEVVPDAVVRALRTWERRRGPVPISVR